MGIHLDIQWCIEPAGSVENIASFFSFERYLFVISEAYRSIFRLSGSIMIYEIFRKISVNLCYNKIMKKKKFIVLSVAIIAIALLLEASIFQYFNDKNAYRTSTVLVDRVLTVLNKNDESKNDRKKTKWSLLI